MTRFVGEAIGHRQGRGNEHTGKSRRKKMEKFLETGSHADVELAQRLNAERIPELPEHDQNRSFVFMELAIAGSPLGRIVIELFDDLIPTGASLLRNRCLPGSHVGLAGVTANKLVPYYAVFLGKNPAASDGSTLRPVNALRAVEAGTVSVSLSGDEVAISLARALTLDTTGYQVVGRVHRGKDLLDRLNDLKVAPDSTPYHRVSIVRAGQTNSRGDFEDLESQGPTTRADAIAKLKEQSASTRSAVLDALEEGLVQGAARAVGAKRRAPDPAGSEGLEASGEHQRAGESAGASAKLQKPAEVSKGPAPSSKAKALDALLGDLGSEEEDSEDGSGEA